MSAHDENHAAASAEDQWQAAIDSLPQLVCIIDSVGRVVRANRVLETWGISDVAGATGRGLHALLHPDCGELDCYVPRLLVQAQHQTATAGSCERVFDRHLQRLLQVQRTSFVWPGTHGSTPHPLWLIVLDNLSCHGGAGRRANETKPWGLIDFAPDMFLRQKADGTLLYVSPASTSLLGMTPIQLVGSKLYSFIHPDDRETVRQTLGVVGEYGELSLATCRMRRADGTYRWMEFNSQLITGSTASREIVSVVRDVQARNMVEDHAAHCQCGLERAIKAKTRQLNLMIRMLQRKIQANERDKAALVILEQRYTMLLENTLTGIYMQEGGRLEFCNDRFARIFGYRQDEMRTVDLAALGVIEGEDMLEQEIGHEEVIESSARDGRKLWLKLSRARFECGGEVYVLGNVIDITEQVHTQARLQASEHELRALSAQLLTTQENERKRIANELHDGLGQRLSAIKFAVEDVLRTENQRGDPDAAARLGRIVENIRDAIEEIRRVSMDLRPSILDDLGLIATLRWFCREFALVCRYIRIDQHISVAETDIPQRLKVMIFRITQEALHNVAKHANADRVSIALCRDGTGLRLTIRDNGIGFDYARAAALDVGLGLKSMHERAELTGGTFAVNSDARVGTEVTVHWPQPE